MPKAPNEKTTEDNFYKLIPTGTGFNKKNFSEKIELMYTFKQLKDYQLSFLKLYGIQADRSNEVENRLYVKPIFVLSRKPAEVSDAAQKRKILHTLLSDRGVLFTHDERGFQDKKVNREVLKDYRSVLRDIELRKKGYRCLDVWHRAKDLLSEADIKICQHIVEDTLDVARQKRTAYPKWAESEIALFVDDGSIQKNRDYLIQHYPQYEEIISYQFGKVFTCAVLEYGWKISTYPPLGKDKSKQLDYVSEDDRREQLEEFQLFRARLEKLETLSHEFLTTIKMPDGIKQIEQMRSNELDMTQDRPKCCTAIASAIRSFFELKGSPLHDARNEIIEERINSVIKQANKFSPAAKWLLPLSILRMTILHNKMITRDSEIPFDKKPPFYPGREKIAVQRYAQLVLLVDLCKILSDDQETKEKNLTAFLYWQGKEIRSSIEAQFWREQLDNGNISLPVIQYQLCCLDYFQTCMPLHLRNLQYRIGSRWHKGGYANYWGEHKDDIAKYSLRLENTYPELIAAYRILWADPQKYHSEASVSKLPHFCEARKAIPVDLYSGLLPSDSEESRDKLGELPELILESALRIAICREASASLAKECVRDLCLGADILNGCLDAAVWVTHATQ